MKRLLDKKISERITRGYDSEGIKSWLNNVNQIDSFKYYDFPLGSKFPRESKSLKNQPTGQVLSFLDSHFHESPDFFVEVQQNVYKSGTWEIIFRGMSLSGEMTRIAVLSFRKR